MAEEKNAVQGKTELVFILDRSGSMSGLESDTIGGFNGMLRRQREESADILVSTVLFDDEVEVIHDRVPIGDVPPLTEREYFTRGCTALLDAIGDSIHHIRNIHKYAREEDRPVRTMFVITTDGLENASVRHTPEKVKKLIEHQEKKHGWEFVFLGANMDAVAVAGDLGIRRENSVEFACDAGGVRENFARRDDRELHPDGRRNCRLESPHCRVLQKGTGEKVRKSIENILRHGRNLSMPLPISRKYLCCFPKVHLPSSPIHRSRRCRSRRVRPRRIEIWQGRARLQIPDNLCSVLRHRIV